ncbi:hypothetical protein LZZ85_00750 [Terrimonas sp. NA20]|uniref:Uncharacterized protein n=1 Tax=Terrimonas ginsenosidimutans TaxID=2908004 RepID=A0ABS9KKC6_9BACT|nr:hypothetical protein [Terrimonas ginsenosidimutans]MCG2612779.1 hypothetical protein [Terrimonas ginsenosidimutans]
MRILDAGELMQPPAADRSIAGELISWPGHDAGAGPGVENPGDRSCDHHGGWILQFCRAGSDDRAAARRDHTCNNGNEYKQFPEDKEEEDG